jgi:hypothetical protein
MTTDDDLSATLAAEAQAASPADAEAPPTLERMQQLAAEVADIDERIEKNTLRIAVLQARRNAIVTRELVELMDDAHVTQLQVGADVFKAGPYYKAVIPVEDQNHPGYAWLEAHEAGSLIKNQVVLEFPRGSEDDAKLAEDMCRKRFQQAEVSRKRMVHHGTLTKWLREVHESGDTMPPLDVIGGTVGRIVKITKAKE